MICESADTSSYCMTCSSRLTFVNLSYQSARASVKKGLGASSPQALPSHECWLARTAGEKLVLAGGNLLGGEGIVRLGDASRLMPAFDARDRAAPDDESLSI